MGRIDKVILHNFKSYAGTHVLGPLSDFTAIIGPNGAGKSNVLDAISFVTGMRSSQLRGQNLVDLIYKPAEESEEEEEKEQKGSSLYGVGSLQTTYVEIIYTLSDEDLDRLPDMATTNLHFRRTIQYRVGAPIQSATSSYALNGKSLPWSQYTEQLEGIGVSIKARNFLVFQGDVESFASKTPRQLCDWVDELSGSAALKEQYELKKDMVEEKSEDFIRELETEKAIRKERLSIKKQKDEADEYLRIMNEMKIKKEAYYLWSFFQYCTDEQEIIERKESLEVSLGEKHQEQQQLDSELQSKTNEYTAARSHQSTLEKKLTDLSRDLDKKRPEHIKLQQEIKYHKKRLEKEEEDIKQFNKKKADHDKILRTLEADLQRLQERIAKITETEATAESEAGQQIQLAAAEKKEYIELKKELNKRIADLNEQKRSKQSELKRPQDLIQRDQQMIDHLIEKQDEEKHRGAEQQRQLDRLNNTIKELEKNIQQNRQRYEQEQRAQQDKNKEKDQLEQELSTLQSRLLTASSLRTESRRAETYRQTIELLQAHVTGVRGSLITLVKPTQNKYKLACQIALGRNSDSIVVNTQEDALACVNFLREKNLGVRTLIPLDKVVVKQPSDYLRNLGGTSKLIIDVLHYDPEIYNAVLYAVGNTLTFDSLDEALRMQSRLQPGRGEDAEEEAGGDEEEGSGGGNVVHRAKIVTIDGTVLHRNGYLTGGISRLHEQQADRFDEVKVREDTRKRDDIVLKLQSLSITTTIDYEEKQRELQATIDRDEISLRYNQADRQHLLETIQKKDTEQQQISKQITEAQPKIKRLQTELERIQKELSTVDKQIATHEDNVFRDFNRRIGVTSIREYEEGRLSAVEAYNRQVTELRNIESKLISEIEYESKREDMEETAEKLRKKRDNTKKHLETIIKKEKDKNREIDMGKEAVAEALEAVRDAETQLTEKDREIKDTQKRLSTINEHIDSQQRLLNKEKEELERIAERKTELMKQIQVENIVLPSRKKRSRTTTIRSRRGGRKKKTHEGEDEKRREEEEEEDEEEEEEKEETNAMEEDEDGSEVESIVDLSQYLVHHGIPTRNRIQGSTLISILLAYPGPSSPMCFVCLSRIVEGDPCEYLDFSVLSPSERETLTPAARQRIRDEYLLSIAELSAAADKLAPNLKAIDKYTEISNKLKAANEEKQEKQQALKAAEEDFADIQEHRRTLFMSSFDLLRHAIEEIYSKLTASADLPQGGKAMLMLGDIDTDVSLSMEPYHGGVLYRVMPPMKRYMPLEALSGGEKTVASLALIFAIHAYQPSPFFVLDEIDAALDNINVMRVSNYIRSRAMRDRLQCIVISLKETFYSKAQALIGIYRDITAKSSGSLTLDLTKYDSTATL